MPMFDPLTVLQAWRDEAAAAGEREPDAMALATATPDGRPAVRIVLCRGIGEGALRFFTNYESRKGSELDHNPRAAVCFFFSLLGRQVRVEGPVTRLPPAESDAYFAGRPRGHQLAALASPQSRPIATLDELRARKEELALLYKGQPVPRPPHWGGYALRAEQVELWRQGDDRLHERVLYVREGDRWRQVPLAP